MYDVVADAEQGLGEVSGVPIAPHDEAASRSTLLCEETSEETPSVPLRSAWGKWAYRMAATLAGTAVVLSVGCAFTLSLHGRVGKPLSYDMAAPLQDKQIVTTSSSRPECQSPGPMPVLWDYDNVGPAVQVKVMTYNLFWWNLFQIRKGNGDSASTLIRQASMPEPYDIMGFQECEDPFLVIGHAGLSNEYEILKDTSSKSAALCIAVRKGSWAILARGLSTVAEDQKYGLRQAQWVRLRHMSSGKTVFFVNHHGPLPMNSGGICGGYATAHRLLQVVAANGHPGDAIVLLGDFNAGDTSQTIQFVEQHLHRVFHGTTLDGADNVFSNVAQASVQNLGSGGSDHDALSVVLHLGGASPAPRPEPALPLLPAFVVPGAVQPPGLNELTSAIDKLKDDFLRK